MLRIRIKGCDGGSQLQPFFGSVSSNGVSKDQLLVPIPHGLILLHDWTQVCIVALIMVRVKVYEGPAVDKTEAVFL